MTEYPQKNGYGSLTNLLHLLRFAALELLYFWGLHKHLNPRPTLTQLTAFAILNLVVTLFTIFPSSFGKEGGNETTPNRLVQGILSVAI